MNAITDVRPATQYLTFSLLGEEYAVAILKVREILEFDTVTRVPKAPRWVRGAINLRGRVVPVVDLAVRFGEDPQVVSRRTCIVILDVAMADEAAVVGILVDSVSQVVDLKDEDIAPPPSFGTRIRNEELLGVAPVGKKFALILDVDRVLAWETEAQPPVVLELSPTTAEIAEPIDGAAKEAL
jgi:purine-binding chemotaxis protein CheW